MVAEGLAVGLVGAVVIAGPGVAGTLAGSAMLRTGEAGVVVALGLVLFLGVIGAGRAFLGVIAVLGVSWAFLAPKAASEAVLLWRGQAQSVVVTSVATRGDEAPGRRYCAVRHADGTPLSVKIWRGCESTTGPGDTIGIVYDPEGQVPPRGISRPGALSQPLTEPIGVGAALGALSAIAVVRSYRLAS
ncbi:hypothetical protein KK483_03875 [Streptomyces sp. FIT100]|nr:hypothetical protein KK483_03875 [Streptomyces sp. FIT100]